MTDKKDKEEKKKKNWVDEAKQKIEDGDFDFEGLVTSGNEVLLGEINNKHAVIKNLGGRAMVMSSVPNEVFNKNVISFVSFETFRQQYMHKSVEIMTDRGPRHIEQGMWWLKHSGRRQYETIVFDPAPKSETLECFNVWEGLNTKPVKGYWKLTRNHIWKILCNKDPIKFKYVIKWFAWCVQNPQARAEVAVIFKGLQGAGKGFVMSQFVHIFGTHG